LSDILVINIVW